MEPQFGKSSYTLKKVSCNNQPDANAACISAPNYFGLMLYDSDFQPEFRGTQGFREHMPRVLQLNSNK